MFAILEVYSKEDVKTIFANEHVIQGTKLTIKPFVDKDNNNKSAQHSLNHLKKQFDPMTGASPAHNKRFLENLENLEKERNNSGINHYNHYTQSVNNLSENIHLFHPREQNYH